MYGHHDYIFTLLLTKKIYHRSTKSDEATEEPPVDIKKQASQDETAPKPKQPSRKLTKKEEDMEKAVCSALEAKIGELKKSLTDKQVIFNKLSAEMIRMLGVFERLKKMGETRGTEIVEAEQSVSTFLKTIY